MLFTCKLSLLIQQLTLFITLLFHLYYILTRKHTSAHTCPHTLTITNLHTYMPLISGWVCLSLSSPLCLFLSLCPLFLSVPFLSSSFFLFFPFFLSLFAISLSLSPLPS